MDPVLSEIDKEIAELQAKRERREAELEDPTRMKISELYTTLFETLSALDNLGEDLTNGEGQALYIEGKTFIVSYDGVREKR
ncbi:hypothetical protein ACIOHC_36295 [Streptomyces sp. NPDC088252]|uniref:hypothetical protein n=1 Tax=Streptomyces sp. NPDC088252 TaxID=3365845 RepID=UPI003807282E